MATLRQFDSVPANGRSSVDADLEEWDALSSLDGRPHIPGEAIHQWPPTAKPSSARKYRLLASLGFLIPFGRRSGSQNADRSQRGSSMRTPPSVATGWKGVKKCLLLFVSPSPTGSTGQARRMLPKLSGLMAETYECVACMTDIDVSEEPAIQVSCGHLYHSECLLQLVQVALRSPTQFPPRCCRKLISPLSFEHLLSPELREEFTMRQVEQSTPRRVYCANPRCSRFLGARDKRTPVRVYPCPASACGTLTCARCRAAVDAAAGAPVHTCGHEPAHRATLRLGNHLGWVRCPECEQLVERDGGCSHMTCACGAHFCYGCGSKWQTCSCVEWRAAELEAPPRPGRRERDLFAPLQEREDLSGQLELWVPPRTALRERARSSLPDLPHTGVVETVHAERITPERHGKADSIRMSIFTVEEEPLEGSVAFCLPFRRDAPKVVRY